jgi:hypothetical protein
MLNRSSVATIIVSLLITIGYGYLVVVLFEGKSTFLETLSWSFILLLPYALGAIGNYILMQKRPLSLTGAILWPWAFCTGLFIVSVIFTLGLLFCIVVGLPILFPAASLGGVTVWLLQRRPKIAKVALLFIIISPYAASPVEAQFDTPQSITITHTFIDIEASTEVVWENIKSVTAITESEQHLNWLHWLGLPRPVAATLSHEGIGGVRDATFENGLRFDETITAWDEHERISFTIVETSQDLLPPPLDLIDGERFDVLEGTYLIEPLADGTIRLHLTSEHFLGTRFNRYGAWWTDQVMRNLQNYILEIVKERAELAS